MESHGLGGSGPRGWGLCAGPESVSYRTRKLVRRHRALVAGAAAVLLSLAGGIIVSVIFALGQATARVEAELQARVDDVRVYNYGRNAQEIQSLYRGTDSSFPPSVKPAAQPPSRKTQDASAG